MRQKDEEHDDKFSERGRVHIVIGGRERRRRKNVFICVHAFCSPFSLESFFRRHGQKEKRGIEREPRQRGLTLSCPAAAAAAAGAAALTAVNSLIKTCMSFCVDPKTNQTHHNKNDED